MTCCAKSFCHGMNKKNHKDFDRHVPKLVGSFWCILVTIYLYISEMSLRAFNCQTSGAKGTTLVLVASGEIVCWTSREHAQIVLMATANIVLIVVGIPLFWGWFLRKNVVRIFEDQHLRIIGLGGRRDQNVHHGFRKAYGVIYNKFKPAFYYWRLVLFVRKMLLSIVAVFLVEFPVLQGTLALLVMFVFYSLHLTYKPYLVGLPEATSEKENMEQLVTMELCKGMSAGQRETFGQIRSTKQLLDEAMLGIIFHDIDKDKSGSLSRGSGTFSSRWVFTKEDVFTRSLSKAGFIKATSPLLLQVTPGASLCWRGGMR